MSPEKLMAGIEMKVIEENIVAYIESDTTHQGSLPPARKYASASLLRCINQKPTTAIMAR